MPGLFNIGGNGQAYIAGLGVIWVVLPLQFLPWWITFPLAIVAAALVGGFWAFIPGWLQAKRGSHVVITTIMFNFIASAIMVYMVVNVLKPPGVLAPESAMIAAEGRMPKLGAFIPWFKNTDVNFTLVLAPCLPRRRLCADLAYRASATPCGRWATTRPPPPMPASPTRAPS